MGFMDRLFGSSKYSEKAKEYRLAAEQGNARAQYNLGSMYFKGQGVPQDYVEAHKWFNLAAARSPDKDATVTIVQGRDIVAAKMTPSQIAEAQKRASEWKPKQ
jgi:hypothetical protein